MMDDRKRERDLPPASMWMRSSSAIAASMEESPYREHTTMWGTHGNAGKLPPFRTPAELRYLLQSLA